MPDTELTGQNGENIPLLQRGVDPTGPTPLPSGQMFGLLSLLLAEPVMSLSIMPYINELVTQLPITGGDDRKVGYYAGFIISLYFVGEATAVFQWSRLSDSIGRKPVLLGGTLGLIIATILFGLSRSFWTLALSRFLAGALNGNIGVVKSMLIEMTDETNIARAFSLLPLTWAMGPILGSSAGGLLSRPQDRWPELFSNSFWKEYPYFLPCAATSLYAMTSLIIASIFLKETLHRIPVTPRRDQLDEPNPDRPSDLERNPEYPERVLEGDFQMPSCRAILTTPVLLTIRIYAAQAYLEISNFALIPLVYTTSIEFGGLGLEPARMATCLAAFGIMTGILPFFFFDRIVKSLGLRRALLTFMSCLVPAFLFFPINGTRAQYAGVDSVTWILMLVHLLLTVGINMTYGCIFMYISSAAPRDMLGATNGLAQTVASVQRAFGPAITASLFSFSLENNIMGGYGVFYALTLGTLAALWLASRLPPNGWT